MKVFIATKNQKKLVELSRILTPLGFEVLSEKDLDTPLEEVEETGTTFEENAILKATAGLKRTGLISVADDSGRDSPVGTFFWPVLEKMHIQTTTAANTTAAARVIIL